MLLIYLLLCVTAVQRPISRRHLAFICSSLGWYSLQMVISVQRCLGKLVFSKTETLSFVLEVSTFFFAFVSEIVLLLYRK